jgi:AraC family transcriptional regulator
MNRLSVHRTIYDPPGDRVSDLSISDHCIGLHIANPGNIERRLERRLDGEKSSDRLTSPGTLTFVPAFRESEWLWDSEVEILEIYLPAAILERIALEDSATKAFGRKYSPATVTLIDRFAIRDSLLEQLILTLYRELEHNNSHNSLYVESLQNLVAVHLLKYHCSVKILDPVENGRLSKSQLRQVLDYIQVNFDHDLSLAELSKVVQLSSHHFGKLFKQSMGVSPYQYVLKCRVEKAKKLLVNEQLSIVEVGQQVGFYDQSHFNNVFRRYTNWGSSFSNCGWCRKLRDSQWCSIY